METAFNKETLKKILTPLKQSGKSIGFVPTMGALHQGHLSLIKQSQAQNDVTVCSIFVNPLQFNKAEDLANYPRMPEDDLKLLAENGCQIAYVPEPESFYKVKPETGMFFGALETVLEGAFRPGHFSGVGIVVTRLFQNVMPDRAYFGLKDLQQVLVIEQLVRDLDLQVEIIRCPTLREPDGLAMSSRNLRLTPEARKVAPVIHLALQRALVRAGSLPPERVVNEAIATLKAYPGVELEYFTFCQLPDLSPLEDWPIEGEAAFCVAANVGGIRLIDNEVLSFPRKQQKFG